MLYPTRLYHKGASEAKISRFVPKAYTSYASSVMKFLITEVTNHKILQELRKIEKFFWSFIRIVFASAVHFIHFPCDVFMTFFVLESSFTKLPANRSREIVGKYLCLTFSKIAEFLQGIGKLQNSLEKLLLQNTSKRWFVIFKIY